MDHLFGKMAEYAGDAVEGAVRKAFGVKEEDKEKGGLASLFGGGKDKDDEDDGNKGGLFSFGDDKKKDDDTGGFFSKILDRDDDKGGEKRTGFHGLFSEQEGASGGGENEEMPRFDEGSCPGPGLSDGDIYSDLMDVAEEISKGE